MEECGQHHVLAALPWGRAPHCQLDGPRASLERTENYAGVRNQNHDSWILKP